MNTKSSLKQSTGLLGPQAAPPLEEDLVKQYVELHKKHSPKAYYNTMRTLYEFLEVLRNGQKIEKKRGDLEEKEIERKNPLEVSPWDVDAFVGWMNAREDLSRPTKGKYLQTIKRFFDWIHYEMRRRKLPFEHPLPTMEFITLTDKPNRTKKPKKYIPYEKIPKIINKAKAKDFETHIMILLLTHCGMRVSECVTIYREDVHLAERYVETGFETGARKTTKKRNRDSDYGLIFYFPEHIRITLKQYLEYVEAKYPDSEFLFPSKTNPQIHIRTNTLGSFLRKISEKIGVPQLSSHWFRHTLNTNRKYGTFHPKGELCPKDIRKKLRNDAMGDAEDLYDQVEIEKLREIYDYYHPYREF